MTTIAPVNIQNFLMTTAFAAWTSGETGRVGGGFNFGRTWYSNFWQRPPIVDLSVFYIFPICILREHIAQDMLHACRLFSHVEGTKKHADNLVHCLFFRWCRFQSMHVILCY